MADVITMLRFVSVVFLLNRIQYDDAPLKCTKREVPRNIGGHGTGELGRNDFGT